VITARPPTRRGSDPGSLYAGDDDGRAIDPPTSTPGPDASLLAVERLALVRQAVDRLEAPCREIIELRYFGDLSYEEIGGTLN